MRCLLALTDQSDRPFWVTREVFSQNFCLRDFRCRNSQEIEENYSTHWFDQDKQGNRLFFLPTVQVISGATQFINGRHRTAVLVERADRIPIAFAGGPALEMAARLSLEEVATDKPIALPDLPIVDRPEF